MRKTFALLVLVSSAVVAASAQPNPAATTPASTKNAHARTQTIDDLAGKLVERFYDAELGKRYAATLRANLLAGKYDGFTDEAAFAAQVTADLQAVAFDGHLKLSPQPDDGPPRPPADSPTALSKTVEAQARLTPEVAYLRLGNFFGQPEGLAAVRKFMDDNRDAKTLIFDVRTHVGGGLDEMDLMFPYLFDKETVLVAMDTRSTVPGPLEDGPRLRTVAGPSTVVRREHFVVPAAGDRPLSKAKIFVLAGGRTGSAGEHFVLAMRRTHRATVIGESTYGAGNFGSFQKIAGGFRAFIPVGRSFDPDTGKGWDYVGVAPDITVPAAQALTEALVRSGVKRNEAERLATKYGPTEEEIASDRKAPPSVVGI